VHSFEDLIKLITELSKTQNVFIIGGGMLYRSMLPYYDKVYVNKVDADGEAEVFFPNLDNCPEFITHVLPVVEDEGYKTQLYIYRK
jgi:dihydrofolate reductase